MEKEAECREGVSLSNWQQRQKDSVVWSDLTLIFSFSHPSLPVTWSLAPSVKVGRMVITPDQQPPCSFQADIAHAAKASSNICSNNGNKLQLFISAEYLAQILK